MFIDNKNLSDVIYAIAEFVKDYELREKNKNLYVEKEEEKLYRLKEILKMYPVLTTYSVNKAVNNKKLTATIIGNCRYYKKKDVEEFLNLNKKNAYYSRRN